LRGLTAPSYIVVDRADSALYHAFSSKFRAVRALVVVPEKPAREVGSPKEASKFSFMWLHRISHFISHRQRPGGLRRPIFPSMLYLLAIAASALSFTDCSRKDKSAPQTAQARGPSAGDQKSQEAANKPLSEVSKSEMSQSAYYIALEKALARRGTRPDAICNINEPVARRILEEYGAIFIATERVLPPPVCIFKNDEEVTAFHNKAGFSSATIAETYIELQPAAMEALQKAREEAIAAGLDITPRGGTEAARRNFADTRRLWDTRFLPALTYWQKEGRLTEEQVNRLRALPLDEQIKEVLELEKDGIFFSQDLSKSILYSIAAPGTSQHIAMLALDVTEFEDPKVRQILARHGWFQTVKSDMPHFTYLGHRESALPSLGLRAVMAGDQLFWIPNTEKQG
jgi:hypothetical protein